jgi:dihydroflavonol-4-reductase
MSLSFRLMDIAKTLRLALGDRASKVPTRRLPDSVFRILSLFIPQLRMFTSELGRRNDLKSEKTRRELGFSPRPATETIVDCAETLLDATRARQAS